MFPIEETAADGFKKMILSLKMKAFFYLVVKEYLRSPQDPHQMEIWKQQSKGYFTFLLFMMNRKSGKFIISMNTDSSTLSRKASKNLWDDWRPLVNWELKKIPNKFWEDTWVLWCKEDYGTKESRFIKLNSRIGGIYFECFI